MNKENKRSIHLLELVKNLETNKPQFFYVNRKDLTETNFDFEKKSVDEFLDFTNECIYERLFVFECEKEKYSDLEQFVLDCLTLENSHWHQKRRIIYIEKSELNENDFFQEVSLYVNDHFFENLYQMDFLKSNFVIGYKMFKNDFFYVFENNTSLKAYHWERYI